MTATSSIGLVWPDIRKVTRCRKTMLFWIPMCQSILSYSLLDIIPEWYPQRLTDLLLENFDSTLDITVGQLSKEKSGYLTVLLIQSNARSLPVKVSLCNGFNDLAIRKAKIHSTRFTLVRVAHFVIDIDLYQIYSLKVLFR